MATQTPKILQMLRVSNCDSEAEQIVADLLEVSERVADILGRCIDEDGYWTCPRATEMEIILLSARAVLAKARPK